MAILILDDLRDQVNQDIKQNGVRAITGDLLNTQLIDMIDSLEDVISNGTTLQEILESGSIASLAAAISMTSTANPITLQSGVNLILQGLKFPNFDGFDKQILSTDGAGNLIFVDVKERYGFAMSSEEGELEVATVVNFRQPYGMILQDVRVEVFEEPTGSSLIVDVKEGGASVFSTLVSVDEGETTSVGSSAPHVISDSNLADNAEMSVIITQIGSTTPGKGGKIWFHGKR